MNDKLDLFVLKPEFVLKTVLESNSETVIKNRYSDGIITVVNGLLEFNFKDTIISCGMHESIFVPKTSDYTIRCIEKAESRIVNFYTDGSLDYPMHLYSTNKVLFERIFEKLETLLQNPKANRNMIFSLYYQLFSEFFDKNEQKSILPKYVRAAENIIFENLSDNILSCRYIADRLNISEVYLRKLFVKHIGISPSVYIRKIRMEKAKQYLLEGYSVSDAAERVGYSEIYQFSRAYKRHFGICPSKNQPI